MAIPPVYKLCSEAGKDAAGKQITFSAVFIQVNRRAYSLRYTALSNLFCFLPRDKYQYIAARRRSASEMGREDNRDRKNYYQAPQIQREIYEAMKKADEAVYGKDIVDEIRHFLEIDS